MLIKNIKIRRISIDNIYRSFSAMSAEADNIVPIAFMNRLCPWLEVVLEKFFPIQLKIISRGAGTDESLVLQRKVQ